MGLQPFLIGSEKGKWMGESDLSRGKCWHGRGEVQVPGSHLPPGTLPFPLHSLPAQERPAKLPSFLQEAHLSRAGSSQAATQWPLSALEPGTETQRTPSLTYFLFPPRGSGLGPERPYPDWGQEEGKHSPFPFPTLNPCQTHPCQLGGVLQQEVG